MRRRDFITLAGTATTWPLAARAQQSGKAFHIGFLGISLDAPGREYGFTDGQNLVIEYRRSDDPRGVSVAGAELLRAHLDLIVAQGSEVA